MIWIILVLLLLLIYGIFIEPHLMLVKEIALSKKQGVKIAHFTDIHFTWHTTIRRLNKFVKNIKKNQPDLILFTGDLFDKVDDWKDKNIEAFVQMLSDLDAPLGKFAILGNHDFDSEGNRQFVAELLSQSGFTVLKNKTLKVGDLSLSGLDDLRLGQPDNNIQPQSSEFALLMIHEPDTLVDCQYAEQFDLIVAGHSHGGQIRLGPLRLKNKGSKVYDKGIYKLSDKTTIYVNSGIGLTFLPIRLGVPPEIVYYYI